MWATAQKFLCPSRLVTFFRNSFPLFDFLNLKWGRRYLTAGSLATTSVLSLRPRISTGSLVLLGLPRLSTRINVAL